MIRRKGLNLYAICSSVTMMKLQNEPLPLVSPHTACQNKFLASDPCGYHHNFWCHKVCLIHVLWALGHCLHLAPEMRQPNYLSVGIPGLFLEQRLSICLSVRLKKKSSNIWFSYASSLMAPTPLDDDMLSAPSAALCCNSREKHNEKKTPEGLCSGKNV